MLLRFLFAVLQIYADLVFFVKQQLCYLAVFKHPFDYASRCPLVPIVGSPVPKDALAVFACAPSFFHVPPLRAGGL